VVDPPPPPAIPDLELRTVVSCMRRFADDWGKPINMGGADPALLVERGTQAERIQAFANTLLYRGENFAPAGRPELIVFVRCAARLTNTVLASAIVDYAREYLFIERSDLDANGLRRAFALSRS
jgi:hypothetical protein